jgi:hypothetical protein
MTFREKDEDGFFERNAVLHVDQPEHWSVLVSAYSGDGIKNDAFLRTPYQHV